MTLSAEAQEILALMEEVRVHPETKNHLHDDEGNGRKWLSACNITNGHEEASPEYTELMGKLYSKLDNILITPKGQHSAVYYELKNAGYRLRTGEADSFGPLSAVFVCPNADWQVCYG